MIGATPGPPPGPPPALVLVLHLVLDFPIAVTDLFRIAGVAAVADPTPALQHRRPGIAHCRPVLNSLQDVDGHLPTRPARPHLRSVAGQLRRQDKANKWVTNKTGWPNVQNQIHRLTVLFPNLLYLFLATRSMSLFFSAEVVNSV